MMIITSFFLFAALTTLLTAGVRAASIQNDPCKDYVIISARGVREEQGPSPSVTGMINKTLAAVPNGKKVDVVYPATQSVIDTEQGVKWVHGYIEKSLAQCPRQRIALVSWCQGSVVHTMTAASSQLLNNPAAQKALTAFVFTGNPIRAPHRQGNVDEHGGKTNADAKGETALDYPVAFDHYVEQGKVLDICNTGDPVCDNAASQSGIEHHRAYPTLESAQELGANFLIQHLRG
ncbi:hypothetical protein OC842_004853 [Tilletia horrida]|uniref:Cutinase n=1 Tax=Tilletia horrida TaxID=155126 RepID=A0AAN6JJN4_9BASI|nr:hypothetical protein OC842_004853 [Tilletia horrida]